MFDFFINFFNKNNEIETISKEINSGEKFENSLYTEYGNCKEYVPFGLKILFITDTHNCLAYSDRILASFKSIKENDYDICIVLGDVSGLDIDEIQRVVPKEKLFGITGNHDSADLMKVNGITDIHGKVIECKGVKIAAIMGSNRYKNGNYGMLTQDESIAIAEKMEEADILVTHDRPYVYDNHDDVHDGLKGITYYLYKHHIPIHIHGHLHEESEENLKNGTKSICLFQIKLMEI